MFSCEGCAKCCKNGNLRLTLDEYHLIVGETGREIVKALTVIGGQVTHSHEEISPIGVYELQGPCPQLNSEGLCTIYDNRPQVCRDLLLGGKSCLTIRSK